LKIVGGVPSSFGRVVPILNARNLLQKKWCFTLEEMEIMKEEERSYRKRKMFECPQ
jgi:hypothetical protein